MGIDIITGEFCSSCFGVYEIPATDPRYAGEVYHVSFGGPMPTCTCKAYQYFKGEEYDRTCKHIDKVEKEACMWSCQGDGNAVVTLKPVNVNWPVMESSACPNCGEPLCPARIAV